MDTKILASLMVIGLVASAIGVGTYAYFSDTETSTGNTFTAGTLNLKVDIDGIVYDPLDGRKFFDETDIKPGDSGEETISLHVDNDACGFVKFDLTSDSGELNDNMNFVIWNDEGDVQGWQCSDGQGNPIQSCTADPKEGNNVLDGAHESILVQGTLTEDEHWGIGDLVASNVYYYGIVWDLPGTVGNNVQGDSFMADIILEAQQKRNQYTTCPFGELV